MSGRSKHEKKPDKGSPFAVLADVKKKLQAEEEAAKAATRSPAGTAGLRAAAPKRAPAASPSRAPRPSGSHGNSDHDDALTFHRMMNGVVPLGAKATRIPRSQQSVEGGGEATLARRKEAGTAAQAEAEAVHEHLRVLVEGGSRFEVEDDGRRVEGRRVDLPVDMVRRLRRGLLPIDAGLDLHGLRADDARAALGRFLAEKRARGERCVLVVQGKGEHSPGGLGILRGEMAAWLSQGAAGEHVAAFVTARAEDGGEGALYVLLRR